MYFFVSKIPNPIIFDKLPNYSELIIKCVKIAANFAIKYSEKFSPCTGIIKVSKTLIVKTFLGNNILKIVCTN